jgi:probable rRNA maturation factor
MNRASRSSAKAPAIFVLIEEPRWREEPSIVRTLRRAVRLVLTTFPTEANAKSVTILLSNNAKLRALNRSFRGKDKPTNVLSFAPADDPASLGDLAMGFGTVKSEARAQKKNLGDHAAHLAMHGTLHLLGYDHEKSSEARRMEALEIELLATLGIADPYRPPLLPRRPYTKRRKAS